MMRGGSPPLEAVETGLFSVTDAASLVCPSGIGMGTIGTLGKVPEAPGGPVVRDGASADATGLAEVVTGGDATPVADALAVIPSPEAAVGTKGMTGIPPALTEPTLTTGMDPGGTPVGRSGLDEITAWDGLSEARVLRELTGTGTGSTGVAGCVSTEACCSSAALICSLEAARVDGGWAGNDGEKVGSSFGRGAVEDAVIGDRPDGPGVKDPDKTPDGRIVAVESCATAAVLDGLLKDPRRLETAEGGFSG